MCFFTKYRISAHCLRIQSGRYGKSAVSSNKRYCKCWYTFELEDLFHFVNACPHFADLRKKLTIKSVTIKYNLFSRLFYTVIYFKRAKKSNVM